MKRFSLVASFVLAFALTAWSQTPSPNDTQSGTGSSASQASQSSTPGTMGSQGSTGTVGTAGETSGSKSDVKAGHEKKVKGCLESQNGAYVIREKGGKEVAVTGSADMSQYVNHEVIAHGTWSSGSDASNSSAVGSTPSDTAKGSSSDHEFTATKIDSVSDTCQASGSASNSNPYSK